MAIWSKVEEMYGIKIKKTLKVKDVYRIETAEADYCFKKYMFPEDDVRFIASVLSFLQQCGFERGQKVYPTLEGPLYMSHEGHYYTLTNWVAGRRPVFAQLCDFKAAIRTLAKFHNAAEGFPPEAAAPSRIRYSEHRQDVLEYRDLLSGHATTAHLVPLCEEVLNSLTQPFVTEAIAAEHRVAALVHGDYNYPNLIKDLRRKIHLIDFENTSLNVRMQDLSHILHRNCLWDGTRMLHWIEYYERKRPLSPYDLHLLHALLLAPYHVVRNIRIGGYRRAISVTPSAARIRHYRRELRALL